MKSWNEIFKLNRKFKEMSGPGEIPDNADHNVQIQPTKIIVKNQAGKFGTVENSKRDNSVPVKSKRNRGDFYRPYGGYMWDHDNHHKFWHDSALLRYGGYAGPVFEENMKI